MIGVHSAKFKTEKESENIKKAILRHGLKHPVVNDAEFAIWHAFGIRSWPTVVLIDPEGRIVGAAQGEGNYASLDEAIGDLVKKFAKTLKRGEMRWHLEVEKDSVLAFPGKLCAADDRLFIADTSHHRILVTTLDGRIEASIGSGKRGHADGSYSEARFNQPEGVAISGETLYVADTENHRIRAVDLKSQQVRTIAGTGSQTHQMAGGKPLEVALNSPWDVTVYEDRLYMAMAGDHSIWALDFAQDRIGPFAGNGRETLQDGALAESSFSQPSGLTVLDGKLYVADSEISGVRAVDLVPGGSVTTLVGTGLFDFGDQDGVGAEARLQHVLGVHGADGKLYVADAYNHKIKLLDPKTRSCTTFLGDGKPGLVDGKAPRFHEPSGLWMHRGKLYIADQNNHAIRVYDPATREVTTLAIRGKD